jgi:release factor glutamine methyltransferase
MAWFRISNPNGSTRNWWKFKPAPVSLAPDSRIHSVDVRSALREAVSAMRAGGVPSYALAAEVLLMHLAGRDRAWLYAHPEELLDAAIQQEYFQLVTRRIAGEPVQYLTGQQEFWGLEFEVNPDVLIPRPETEHVIEVALDRLGPRRLQPALRIADVGTGSGCIAVTLASELPTAQFVATDISAEALVTAQRNAVRHGVAERIQFVQCDLLRPLAGCTTAEPASEPRLGRFDLIVSNPPYVGRREDAQLAREVRDHEPSAALYAGERGLDLYAPLIQQAATLLTPRGLLVLELSHTAFDHVQALVAAENGWMRVSVNQDLAGIPRVLAAQRA